jgi:hypothetical protein
MAFGGCGLQSHAATAMACLLRNSCQARAESMQAKQLAAYNLWF